MPDLTAQGFEELRPKDLTEGRSWQDMWNAFRELVTGTLFPLAMTDVVHTDLRHGFDRTANILYCQAAKEMRIIDWDSLMEFGMWQLRGPRGRKYIERDASRAGARGRSNAREFVFLQVVCIAESWLQGKERSDGSLVPVEDSTEDLIGGSAIASRWETSERVCDRSFIEAVLDELGHCFEPPVILGPGARLEG
jgi:hypothetical protein